MFYKVMLTHTASVGQELNLSARMGNDKGKNIQPLTVCYLDWKNNEYFNNFGM